mmetsp:Transcript_34173/g.100618  ORF Transcript_34173/g.100618 Transcript_34173/m.100618 type:complete len:284 (-) Transcript_34173:7-858(-)
MDRFALALSAMYLEVDGKIGALEFIVVIPWHMGFGRASVFRLGEHFRHPESQHFSLTEMSHKIRLTMRWIDEHDGPRPLTVDLRSLRKQTGVREMVMPTSLLSLVIVTEFLVFLVCHRRYKRNSSQANTRLIAMLPYTLHLDSPFSSGPLPLLPFLPCFPDFALEELLQFEQIGILILSGHGKAGLDGISGLFPLLQHLVGLGKSIPSLDVLGIVPHGLGRILTGVAPIFEHSMRHGGVGGERRLNNVELFLGVERSVLEGLALLILFGFISRLHRIHPVGME